MMLFLARQVQTAPHFVERLFAQTAAEGTPVTLTATVVGVPTPTVSWSKDGQQLAPPAGDEKRYHMETDGSRVSLRFDGVVPTDAGWYQCTAMNSAGNATSRAKLMVQASTMRTLSLCYSVILAVPSICLTLCPSVYHTGINQSSYGRLQGLHCPAVQWALKDASFLRKSEFLPSNVIQGRPRSTILVPIESAHTTSY